MNGQVLIDTGPLVAILHSGDSEHQASVELLHEIEGPLLTCWPVLAEAAWLLRAEPQVIQELFFGFSKGFLRLLPMDESSMFWIAAFYRRYRKLSPQLADAALMYLAERDNLETIFTLDRRDFSIYRAGGNRALRIL